MARRKLSEIDQEEAARREQAHRYEVLTNERDRLRRSIDHLSALGAASDITPLEEMRRLCDAVPAHLTTKGSGFMPGGFNVQTLLRQAISDALADLTRKADAAATAVATARKQLVKVEAALDATDATDAVGR